MQNVDSCFMSALMVLTGISSALAAFPFLSAVISLSPSYMVCCYSLSAGCMYAEKSFWCLSILRLFRVFYQSLQLFFCCSEKALMVVWFVCVCMNLFKSYLVTIHSSLRFPCPAASSACLARFSMWSHFFFLVAGICSTG